MPLIACWAGEAGSIQEFIFDTGQLADAVGASLLVDRLVGDLRDEGDSDDSLLGAVIRAACGDRDAPVRQVRFSRRGGGAFIAFFADAEMRDRARALWQAVLPSCAPGLRWADAVADAGDAKQATEHALAGCRAASRLPRARLPEIAPPVLRVPRTGRGAAVRERTAKGMDALDASSVVRRRFAGADRGASVAGARTAGLLGRFGSDASRVWPRNFEDTGTADAFPLLDKGGDVAFIHADGNGLGLRLRELVATTRSQDLEQRYREFSLAVAASTAAAAEQATESVLAPHARDNSDGTRTMPARPLILGGDDLLIIVRGDLALSFAEEFLLAFESDTRRRLGTIEGLGGGLTAACGLVYVKPSFPFSRAAELASDLCNRAKSVIKQEAAQRDRTLALSALAMQRVTTSVADARLDEMLVDGRSASMGLPAYVVGSASGTTVLPRLDDLRELAAALGSQAAPRGAARKLLTDLHEDLSLARQHYARMRSNLRDAAPMQSRALDAALDALGVPADAALPFGTHGTPWPDALLLRDLEAASSLGQRTAQEHA